MRRFLTLTTDFGTRDTYVAAVKGVVLSHAPDVQILDVTHEIEPQDVVGGSYQVSTLLGLFPEDTIHLIVVDPGVGSARRAIVVDTEAGTYVAPDNGVLTPVFDGVKVREVREITDMGLVRPRVSSTFHGRDVFAPAAAHLALGVPPARFGDLVEDPVRLNVWDIERGKGRVRGQIVHIDRFGNVITNLSRADLPAERDVEVSVGSTRIRGMSRTYTDVETGGVLALMGSQDTVEISINGGRAAETLSLSRGDRVEISKREP